MTTDFQVILSRSTNQGFPKLTLLILGLLLEISAMTQAGVANPQLKSAQLATTPDAIEDVTYQISELTPISPRATAGMEQVTSVSQLQDVQPSDWAYQSLQSLVDRYGCIVGYPDRTYRGNRALSRYEFAAGLNACLDRLTQKLASDASGFATKAELEAVQKLQEEFAAELAALRGLADTLETRAATLEKQQFSTTTKLFGQAIVGVQGRSAGTVTLAGLKFEDDADNINVITNIQLSLLTQFDERSLLFTSLQAGSGDTFGSLQLTNDVQLGYASDTNGNVVLSDLTYRQLIGNNLAIVVGPVGVNMVNVFRGANRIESAGQGPLSLFAQRNPILNINGSGAGVGFDWQLDPALSLQGVYFTNRANDPSDGGIFGSRLGGNAVGFQLTFSPTDTIDLALHYANAYSPLGNLGMFVGDDQLAIVNPRTGRAPLKTNAIGTTISWRISQGVTLGGWAGYTHSRLVGEDGDVETINWMAFVNFPDLGGRGNLAAFYFGQPPRIISSDLPNGRNIPEFVSNGNLLASSGGQPDTTYHLEAFYRVRLNDNISVTPGIIVIFAPRQNSVNDNIYIGTFRTTFTF
jgi:hypothetical protein